MAGKPPSSRASRDSAGRFAPGNQVGKGHGQTHKPAMWRVAFQRAVSPGDVEAVAKHLVKAARGGERWAIELLLDRCLGKPATFEALELADRIEALESRATEHENESAKTS